MTTNSLDVLTGGTPFRAVDSCTTTGDDHERSSGGTPEMKLKLATDVIGVASHALLSNY